MSVRVSGFILPEVKGVVEGTMYPGIYYLALTAAFRGLFIKVQRFDILKTWLLVPYCTAV